MDFPKVKSPIFDIGGFHLVIKIAVPTELQKMEGGKQVGNETISHLHLTVNMINILVKCSLKLNNYEQHLEFV